MIGKIVANRSRPPRLRKRSTRGVQYETDLTREIDIRSQRRTLLVVTNGERTERDYFDGLKTEPWITVTLRTKVERGTAKDVAVRAARVREEDEYDDVWAVADVDEENVYPAIQCATEGQVEIALSAPSFEVWLILHISEKMPRFNNAEQAGAYLRSLIPTWDKRKLRFSDFRDGIKRAVERAKRLGDPPEANPSTAVWRLIEHVAGRDNDTYD
jgi:hypothetical protein